MKRGLLISFSLAGALVGCREGPAVGARVASYTPPMDAVVILDESLSSRSLIPFLSDPQVAIEQHLARRSGTGSLEVVVTARNRTESPLAVELRASFYDPAGVPSGDPSEWQALNLPQQGTGVYREASLLPTAAHYVVEIRHATRR